MGNNNIDFFFQKVKCKILLEANIDDVALPTLNIPIF